MHIANWLFLPFYLLPFYLLGTGRRTGGPGRGKLTFRLLEQGKSIAHCKSLDFTFLPFTFLPFGGGWTWKRETHTSVTWRERALHIANTLTLPFYLLPFYLLREAGGPGRRKLTLRSQGGRALHIANLLFLPFYLLPFYLASISELCK